jgi:hypothetical protein
MTNERELAKVTTVMVIGIFISSIGLIVCFIGNMFSQTSVISIGVGWGMSPLILSMAYFIYKYIKGDIR